MNEETVMRQLIRMLYRKGADQELILAVVTNLETDENFLKMMEALSKVENPSRTWLLSKSILIGDPEESAQNKHPNNWQTPPIMIIPSTKEVLYMTQDKRNLSEINSKVLQAVLREKSEHEQKMQTDPEYRKFWEKQERDFQKCVFPHLED